MSVDSSILSLAISEPQAMTQLLRAGVTDDYFVDVEYQKVWLYLNRMKLKHGKVPSREVVRKKFSKVKLPKVRKRDLPVLVEDLKQRKKYMDFLESLDQASRDATDPEAVDVAMSVLTQNLNSISTKTGGASIVDAFSAETNKRMLKDYKMRRRGDVIGIPTGLRRLDFVTGGLQPGRMVTLMARTGMGKSWINLLFVVNAVLNGHTVGLYPLEMTLEETLLRLYTMFSYNLYGQKKVLRNLDLVHGRITKGKLVQFQHAMEDQFPGQLFIADLGTMSDPYTIDRIGAETEIYKWDMFWIDYLTLMKVPGVRAGQEDYQTIRMLSSGVKQLAVAHRCVGGASVQVNRDALRVKAFLPRPEHIAFGDSIAHDSDLVIPLNRRHDEPDHIYYGLTKHRGGPEIGKTRATFSVNEGNIKETKKQEAEEDDDDD